MQDANGKMSANCFHNGCHGRGWQDFKDAIGKPVGHHYEPPLKGRSNTKRASDKVISDQKDGPAPAKIAIPGGEPLSFKVSPTGKGPQRLVIASRGQLEHRDRINTDSSGARERFIKKLAAVLGIERDTLAPLIDQQMTKLATEADQCRGAGQ